MKKHLFLLLALVLQAAITRAQVQRITETIAGSSSGYSGDGGPARSAHLSYPQEVCSDAAGNVYIADQNGTRIRKITAQTGIITTIAGSGTISTLVEGVPATASAVSASHMITDVAGNLYLAYSNYVRKIDAVTGIITMFAGSTTSGYSGDGGPATAATFANISGICTDAGGNLYISDLSNNRIRKVDAVSNIVTTFAGTGTSGFTGDGGPAVSARISNPSYIACDAAGDIIFMDGFGGYFRKINSAGTISSITMIPADPTLVLGLSGSSGLCAGGNDIYFDETSCSCRGMDLSTDVVSWIGGNYYIESFADDTTSVYAYMDENRGLCTDQHINIYIADEYNHRVRKLMNLTHTPSFTFGPAQYAFICAGGTYSLDSLLWISDMDLGQVETWSVVTPPLYGTLSGFPTTALSRGSFSSAKPSGLSYNAPFSFTTQDQFRIRVSDGALSDTITIYVGPKTGPHSSPGVISGASSVCTGSTITLSESVSGGIWSVIGSGASIDSTGTVTGLTPGTSTIAYSVAGGTGCFTDTTFTVSVKPLPSLSGLDVTPIVCVGGTTPLADPASGGTWIVVNGHAGYITSTSSVLGISPGTDTLIYTVTVSGCTASTSAAVLVLAQPVAGPVSGRTTVCTGRSITLADVTPGGTWAVSNGNGVINSSGELTGNTPGTVTVFYVVTNYCGSDTARYAAEVTDCIDGVPNISPAAQLNIFPNPATSTVTVAWPALGAPVAGITITDAAGRLLFNDRIAGTDVQGSKEFSVAQLPAGSYLVTINAAGTRYVRTLAVQPH